MVRPKKHLGQHFLKDLAIAAKIAGAFQDEDRTGNLLEIGPGTGVLTQYLIKSNINLTVVDIDSESIAFLKRHYNRGEMKILEADFLQMDLRDLPGPKFGIIGNFPYNISSQIFFKILDWKDEIPEIVCMLQREVAKRIASPPGNKDYGILSVLLQAYYSIEYLFTVEENAFHPPPKVKSGVIRLVRNLNRKLDCNEVLFRRVVKQGFQNRRKTLRNALKPLNLPTAINDSDMLKKRAEQLSVLDFIQLTKQIEESGTNGQI